MSNQVMESSEQALNQIIKNMYVNAATSDNTRRAYKSDIEHFKAQGGELPATPEMVEGYLKQCADHLNPRTITRRITAIRQWHKLSDHDDPTKHPLVMKTLRGIKRLHGRPRQQAIALRLSDMDKITQHLKQEDTLINIRNRALILVGFFGAFRRSELVVLTWEHIEFVSDGMIITVPRSKTNQAGEGAQCVIPFGNDIRCPVRSLLAWRKASKLWEGPIFRRISKTGNLSKAAISAYYLSQIIQRAVAAADIPNPEQYSAHSLRRGFATEAARLGASMPSIQRHGRWKSTKTVIEYIEAGRQFADSAVNVLFEF